MAKRAKTKQQNDAVSSQRKKPKRDEPNSDDATVSFLPSERKNAKRSETNSDVFFVGKPIPAADARQKWPHRYPSKVENKGLDLAPTSHAENDDDSKGNCHDINDDAYIKFIKYHDKKSDFISDIKDLNTVESIVSKDQIVQNVDLAAKKRLERLPCFRFR